MGQQGIQQDEVCDRLEGVGKAEVRAHIAGQGQPVQIAEEHDLKHEPEIKSRNGYTNNGDRTDGYIKRFSLPAGAQHPQWDADQDRQQDGSDEQLDRGRSTILDLLQDRSFGADRDAKVAMQQIPHVY